LGELPRKAILWCCVAGLSFWAPQAALAQKRNFDIPSQPANRAIPLFAQQAGIQIVAPGSRLRNLRTKAVKGQFEPRDALEAMLAGTGIQIVSDADNTIALAVPAPAPLRLAHRDAAPANKDAAPSRPAVINRPAIDMQKPAIPPTWPEEIARADAGEILVTGSRIRANGDASPVPRTVIDARLITDLGQANAAEAVDLMPQNVASQSDATSGTSLSGNIGSSFANLRGLNPTFGTRTLTLVNSRRFVPSSDGGQVDLNLIPSVMIKRIETVTGGASAAYGSDAVAGVVNIILDDRLEGFKGQVDFGQTRYGDGRSAHAAAAYGLKLGPRGRLIVGGEYQRNRGIAHCYRSRDWCADGWAILTNEAAIQPGTLNVQPGTAANTSGYNVPGSSGYGLPNYILGRQGALVYNAPYGVIRNFVTAAGTSTTAFSSVYPAINPPFSAVDRVFTPDGKGVTRYDPGLFGPKLVGGLAQGGDNSSAYDDQYIQTPIERFTSYASATYALSDALTLSSELTYAVRSANSQSFTAATRSTMPIKADNAFLPAAVTASLNGQAFSLGKDIDSDLDNRVSARSRVVRALIGLSGTIGPAWQWDTYYQFGDNKRHSSVRYSRNNDAFTMAIDAVRDPNDPSRTICRPLSQGVLSQFTASYQAKLQQLYAACRPLNLFGTGNMDPAAIAFAWRPVGEDFRFRQDVIAGSVEGQMLRGRAAGPIGLAAGVEYRFERGDVTHGGINASDYAFSFGLDYAGRIEVLEEFVEADVPLFRNAAFGRLLALNGAVRHTGNRSTDTLIGRSRSIDAISWKIGGIYEPIAGARLRATQSRDIRAAGFRELFQKTAPTEEGTAQGRVNNPNIQGPNQADPTPIYTGGNFALTPEKADTTTVGLVLAPVALPGFSLSLDWYRIRLKDTIATLNGQRTVDLCFSSNLLCDRISFASPTNIVRVDAGLANVGRIDIKGLDFEAAYRLPLADLSRRLPGTLSVRFLLNHQYAFRLMQNATAPTIDYAGQAGTVLEGGDFYPSPKWMWNGLIRYEIGRLQTTMTIRHIGKGILNVTLVGPEDPGYSPTLAGSISSNRVPSRTYLNLAMSYALLRGADRSRDIEIFGSVENLFDRVPPAAPGGLMNSVSSLYPTNPVFFDTFGMRFRAGIRAAF